MGLDALEGRKLFAAFVTTPLDDVAVNLGGTSSLVLDGRFANNETNGTLVRLATSAGNVDVELFDVAVEGRSAAPITAANFLRYVTSGRFDSTFLHRSVPGFIVQGGGFTLTGSGADFSVGSVTTDAPIQNEFSSDRSNLRGTLAMAKLDPSAPGGGPDSATSQFFFNLKNNAGDLDGQNGGFTVFGRVLDNAAVSNDGMAVVDAIAGLQRYNFGDAFTDLPLTGYAPSLGTSPNPITPPQSAPAVVANNFVRLASARVIPEFGYTVTTADRKVATAAVVTDNDGTRRVVVTGGSKQGTTQVTVTGTDVLGQTTTDTFSVTVRPTGDLGVTLAPVAGTLVVGGSSVTLSATLTNAGTSSLKSKTAVRFIISSDIVDGPDVVLADVNTTAPTKAGSSRVIRKRVVLPTDLPNGAYRFVAVADPAGLVTDTNQANNRGGGAVLAYQRPFVDLVPSFAVEPTGVAGKRLQSFVTLRNEGNVRASGRYTVTLDLDTNGDGTRETVVGTLRSGVSLLPGQTRTVRVTINSSGLVAGQQVLTGSLAIVSGFADSDVTNNLFNTTLTLS
jgi:peptidyl-prolyl cis-trans isomerase A (cyclophilin A)